MSRSELGWRLEPEGPADLSFVQRLCAEIKAEDFVQAQLEPAALTRILDQQFHAQNVHLTLHYPDLERSLIWLDDQPVGRLYCLRQRPVWRLVEIGLLADHRGHGLGQAVIAQLLDQARKAGADGVSLSVAITNVRARALYQRLGFRLMTPPDRYHLEMLCAFS